MLRKILFEWPAVAWDAIWLTIRVILTIQWIIVSLMAFACFVMVIIVLVLAALGIRWGW